MPDASLVFRDVWRAQTLGVLPLEPAIAFSLADTLARNAAACLCRGAAPVFCARCVGRRLLRFRRGTQFAEASFRGELLPRARVFGRPLESFRSQHAMKFSKCGDILRSAGTPGRSQVFLSENTRVPTAPRFIALSVPNRERWQFRWMRWTILPIIFSAGIRYRCERIESARVSVHSIKKEQPPASPPRSKSITSCTPAFLIRWLQNCRTGFATKFRRIRKRKLSAINMRLFSLALAVLPYVKWRSFVGPYLYCLARKLGLVRAGGPLAQGSRERAAQRPHRYIQP